MGVSEQVKFYSLRVAAGKVIGQIGASGRTAAVGATAGTFGFRLTKDSLPCLPNKVDERYSNYDNDEKDLHKQ
jgi:hypothetical protein